MHGCHVSHRKKMTHNASPIFRMIYKMVSSLQILLICTQRLFPRHMVCFASIRHHKITCIFLVRTLTLVSIIYDMVNRLLHRLLIPTMPFTDCNRPGNHSVRFPLSYCHRTRTQSLQLGYYFSQNKAVKKELINLNWIVFESRLTVSSFMNPYILSDIKDCHPNTSIRVFTND